jgi:hypothetical protein
MSPRGPLLQPTPTNTSSSDSSDQGMGEITHAAAWRKLGDSPEAGRCPPVVMLAGERHHNVNEGMSNRTGARRKVTAYRIGRHEKEDTMRREIQNQCRDGRSLRLRRRHLLAGAGSTARDSPVSPGIRCGGSGLRVKSRSCQMGMTAHGEPQPESWREPQRAAHAQNLPR